MTAAEKWLATACIATLPRLKYVRLERHLPKVMQERMSGIPDSLKAYIDISPVPFDTLKDNPFDWALRLESAKEEHLKKRLVMISPRRVPVLGIVREEDFLAKAMVFSDGSEAIVVSSGLLNFLWTYSRALSCLISPARIEVPPEFTLPELSHVPMSNVDLGIAISSLYANYVKLGIVVNNTKPTLEQVWLSARMSQALIDFVLAHELTHLIEGHLTNGRTPSESDEFQADHRAVGVVSRVYGALITSLAVEVFFGASVGIYQHIDSSSADQMAVRWERARRAHWRWPLFGIGTRGVRWADKFRQASIFGANSVTHVSFGVTVLDIILQEDIVEDVFLDIVLRWYLAGIPTRATRELASIVLRVLKTEFPNATPAQRLVHLREAQRDSQVSAPLRRISLLWSFLDASTAIELETAVADDRGDRASGKR